jgi:hypothetical protein
LVSFRTAKDPSEREKILAGLNKLSVAPTSTKQMTFSEETLGVYDKWLK